MMQIFPSAFMISLSPGTSVLIVVLAKLSLFWAWLYFRNILGQEDFLQA